MAWHGMVSHSMSGMVWSSLCNMLDSLPDNIGPLKHISSRLGSRLSINIFLQFIYGEVRSGLTVLLSSSAEVHEVLSSLLYRL